ncbi:MAG: hypothetical protein JXB08_00405 [Bacilli bacterium]|nr:hypothetical protein [Bacilli bacterium]MBN2877982.1 hypothetical protein [Bacilli bacterium]
MGYGILFVVLVVFAYSNLWFGKAKPKKIGNRILISVVFFVLFGFLFSWGFTPRMSLFYNKLTLFGQNQYVTDYLIDDYAIVEYEDKDGNLNFVIYSKIYVGYMEADTGIESVIYSVNSEEIIAYMFSNKDGTSFIAFNKSVLNSNYTMDVYGATVPGTSHRDSSWIWFELPEVPDQISSAGVIYEMITTE